MILVLLKEQQYLGSGGDRGVTLPCLPPVLMGLGLFTKVILEGASGVFCDTVSRSFVSGLERAQSSSAV